MPASPITVFGEVLFDQFPDGHRLLGGAPFNVAWHLQAFGLSPHFISRVGNDGQGDDIIDAMRAWGMDVTGVQRDDTHPTGQVLVRFIDGEPHYDIVAGQAYDYIDASFGTRSHGLLYHGSLALRHPVSRAALDRLKRQQGGRIFVDVNLRPPWWQITDLVQWLSSADWVKLNLAEFSLLGGGGLDIVRDMADFLKRYQLEGLVVTLGEGGAHALTHDGEHRMVVPQITSGVIDTVGAGDAFSAVVLLGLHYRWSLSTLLERAQDFASAIVRQRGATPADRGLYRSFKVQWRLGNAQESSTSSAN